MAIIVIAAFIFSWGAFIFSGYVVTPWIPSFSPEPVVSGYLGFFSGIISLGFIPLLFLLALLFRIISGYKVSASLRRVTLGVWMVTLLAFASTVIFSIKNFSNQYRFEETLLTSDISSEEPLIVNISEHPEASSRVGVFLDDIQISRDQLALFNRSIKVSHSDDTRIALVCESSSHGPNRDDAQRSITRDKSIYDSAKKRINLSLYSMLQSGEKFRNQQYDYDLQLPIGSLIKFESDEAKVSLGKRKYQTDILYKMTEDGLEKV